MHSTLLLKKKNFKALQKCKFLSKVYVQYITAKEKKTLKRQNINDSATIKYLGNHPPPTLGFIKLPVN